MMLEHTEQPISEVLHKPDPYGDVALGVECAWPDSIPVSHAAPADFPFES